MGQNSNYKFSNLWMPTPALQSFMFMQKTSNPMEIALQSLPFATMAWRSTALLPQILPPGYLVFPPNRKSVPVST